MKQMVNLEVEIKLWLKWGGDEQDRANGVAQEGDVVVEEVVLVVMEEEVQLVVDKIIIILDQVDLQAQVVVVPQLPGKNPDLFNLK